jgi:hypothetical protein
MPACPSCQRPLATSRASCLYCGAALPRELRAVAPAAAPPPTVELAPRAGPSRTLVLIQLEGPGPALLANALACSRYDATLLTHRGGWHLHRVLETPSAESEAARLRALGLGVIVVPEAELQLRPLQALRGERLAGKLNLRSEDAQLEVSPADLLLIVSGPILRQRQPSLEPRKVNTSRAAEGWRVHLHRLSDPRAIEVDPDNFEPGFAASGSTWLELDSWLAELGSGVPRDDRFRLQPPALGAAEPEPRGSLSALGRLGSPAEHAAPAARRAEAPLLLDNLQQFRYYSAWHAALERQRRALASASDRRPPATR